MMYNLPKRLEVGGKEYDIRSDYRAVLDICTALSDPELSAQEKALVTLQIFYPDFESMDPEDYKEALEKCYWFVDCGDDDDTKQSAPKLMDWEQDFPYIIAPVNRVLGKEVRDIEYLHWWTFVSAYNEIGDCTYAQIVRIRQKRAKGEKLDKEEAKWYRQNRRIIDFKMKFTDEDNNAFKEWGV